MAPIETIRLLRKHNADFTRGNALHKAASSRFPQRPEVMAYLLDEAGVDINQLEHVYDSVIQDWKAGGVGTALHSAVRAKRPENIKLLLDRGINKDLKDKEGRAALDRAREANYAEGVTLLESWGRL
ncbi:hypothetical protein FZEAL_9106 [Fusarium zealandicum]|uniref:Ankyrin n=1 Tax=Fusarium zealandicum TaxID=1053134 RepID=A0A8H4UCM8_9HYPO|nr:hypothetical protein FZEAL_9106 [Fusarium zealandicum]